ncbi:hypothetical protein [Streptomyces sp. 8K308]|nr:hypothetical protein [Streptomyces sp. 8K308]
MAERVANARAGRPGVTVVAIAFSVLLAALAVGDADAPPRTYDCAK